MILKNKEQPAGKDLSYRQMVRIIKKVLADPVLVDKALIFKPILKWGFFWMVVVEAILVLQPYPIKWFFDGLTNGWPRQKMLGIFGLMFLVYFLGTRVYAKMDRWRHKFFWYMWGDLWGYSHWRELKLSTNWHVQHSTGEKESIVARNISKALSLVGEVIFSTFPITLRIIFTAIGVWWLGFHFGTIAVLTLIIFAGVLVKTERKADPYRKEFRQQIRKIETDGMELVKNWRTLKQFGIEDMESFEHWKMLDKFCEKEMVRFDIFQRCRTWQENVISSSRPLMYAAIYYFFDPAVGLKEIGSIILASAWMERIYSNLYRFENLQRFLNEGKEAIRELCQIAELVPSVSQPVCPQWPADGLQGRIGFQNVSFSFPSNKEHTLYDINLEVQPHQCIALVGRTGSGKSTMVSLITREYDPTKGTIIVDGIPLSEMDYDRYRQGIAVVSQKIDLFDDTIAGNIWRTRPTATLEEVVEAAKQAYADEFISKLERGYETLIGEDGIQLSGGQRQRLAIARALLRRPKILILDEATSSLDGESQAEVQKAIDHLIRNRAATIFVIAHRLSTIRQADQVMVLNDGRIMEFGTHQELRMKKGLYAHFLEQEFKDYHLGEQTPMGQVVA